MDLGQFIKDNKQELAVWAEFEAGFEIELQYCDRREMERMVEASKVRRYDPKTHQPAEDYNDEEFNRRLAGKIRDWRGLTLGRLQRLVNIDLNGADPAEDVPCTPGNRATLVAEVYGLNNFIRETIMDLQAFRAGQVAEEAENLETTRGYSSE